MTEASPEEHEFERLEVVIEKAKPSDAEAIMRIKRDAWLGAYTNEERGVTAEDVLAKFRGNSMAEAVENWRVGIAGEGENTGKATFVARSNGMVIGYTSPDTQNGKRRVGALYVSPTSQKRGVGDLLLRQALAWHGNTEDVYLHAISYNANAISFYEKHGFERTGVELPELYDEKQGIKLLPVIEMVIKAKPE